MTKPLERAASLLNVVKRLNYNDCANFVKHLNDQGIELLCRVIYYILNGDLVFHNRVRGKLRNKISAHLQEFKRLATPPHRARDIAVKRNILQRGGILGVLTAIASSVVPLIAQLLANKRN